MKSVLTFLRILFERRNEQITLLLLDEGQPSLPEQHSLRPQGLFVLIVSLILAAIIVISAFLYVTPIGNMIFDTDETEIRAELAVITQRIIGLQDSLLARDEQLASIKNVLAGGSDTLFTVRGLEQFESLLSEAPRSGGRMGTTRNTMNRLESEHIIFSNIFKLSPEFPSLVPLKGTLSQSFNPANGHFGIDIAAQTGSLVRSVADGVVINSDWTLSYGYVINVQHGGGFVTVYKHLSNVLLREGDVVLNGDVIGAVGKTGFLSSGPHLHFEIWKDGVPMNPADFLINL